MTPRLLPAAALLLLLGAASPGAAQTRPPADLALATLEELMNIEITSAARVEQRADSVPAAVYVITRDDIRRSGMTTLPELLRVVPGLNVASINGNKWAVSARGFNGLFSDKLLVLIDGRTVYSRLFSGVLWDAEELMVENIDRIEVVRGPGAAVWGANAVNGVINVVTRSAADTQGSLVRATASTADAFSGAVRHGGMRGATAYRAYAQWSDGGSSLLDGRTGAADSLRSATGGLRLDRSAGQNTYLIDGRVSAGRFQALWANLDPASAGSSPIAQGGSEALGAAVLARWTRVTAPGASVQGQISLDADDRSEPIAEYSRRSLDLYLQYHTPLARRHRIVMGGGWRHMHEAFAGGPGYRISPAHADDAVVSAFVQDEIAMVPTRFDVTLGTKIEHDTANGTGLQPTARLMWHVVPERQHVWAAVSRALRTPSISDRTIQVDYPPMPQAHGLPIALRIHGNPDLRPETLFSTEVGYRVDVGSVASFDVAAYRGRYDHLPTQEPLSPVFVADPVPHLLVPVRFEGLLAATTTGVELTGHWQPTPLWRFSASYAGFRLTPRVNPASLDSLAADFDGDAPRHQWQLHGTRALGNRLRLDGQLFHTGRLAGLAVPAYTRADARFELTVTGRWTAAIVGQNLLHRSHVEFSGEKGNVFATAVRRSVGLWLVRRM